MRAQFVQRQFENEAQTIVSCYFRPLGRYRYEPGQYAVIDVPHDADSRGTSRTMTLTSHPTDELISICFRVTDNGSSYKKTLMNAAPGLDVTIQEALGDLILPLDPARPLIFVAGGIGIASYVAMIRDLTLRSEPRRISVHYAARSTDDIALQDVFLRYARHYPLTRSLYTPAVNSAYSNDLSFDAVQSRRLAATDIVPQITDDTLIYLSGTEPMVESLRLDLQARGADQGQVVFDYFDGYA